MTSRLQQRRDTAANWSANNPTLAAGEIGITTDTKLVKIGDGTTAWNSLTYGGLQGVQGLTGSQGANGAQGTAGFVGSNGSQGTQGTQGTTGLQGTTGTGVQGTSGAAGADPTMTVFLLGGM